MRWPWFLAVAVGCGVFLVVFQTCQEPTSLQPIRPYDIADDPIGYLLLAIGGFTVIDQWWHR